MKRKYCCNASRDMYVDYYTRQSGTGLPVFHGSRGQRGHGLGSMLSGFFRSAWPVIRQGLGFLGKQALKTGAEIVGDVAQGESLKDSAKKRVSEKINEFVPDIFPQSGSGKRRRRVRKVKRQRKKSKKTSDIFS